MVTLINRDRSQPAPRPVILGEVLLDVFPSRTILGGAPFNVAWNLQGLGMYPLFISRIGKDPHGDQILQTMQDWGMDISGVQVDAHHPTGTVQVTLQHGQPEYEILPDQAYDFIEAEPALTLLQQSDCSILYHGTLAMRTPQVRGTLQALRCCAPLPIFLDLNLRDPWWKWEWIENLLADARWVKLNEGEMATVLQQDQIPSSDLSNQARELRTAWDLELLLVTLGGEGALWVLQDRELRETAVQVNQLVDTVGAGDAFSAVTILGLQRGWLPEITLRRALQFAAAICQIPGATSTDSKLYKSHLQQWDREDRT